MVLDRRDPYDPYHLAKAPPWVYKPADVKAYFGLEIAGIVTLPIVVLIIWANKDIQRDKSVYNFFIVLILACFFHCLTYFTHGFVTKENPNPPGFKLCLAQAMFTTGNSTAQAMSALGLVVKVWVTAASLDTQKLAFLDRAYIGWSLFCAPWLAWIGYAVMTLVVGLRDPSSIKPTVLYCYATSDLTVDSHHYTSAAGAAIIIVLESHLAWIVFRHYKELRRSAADHREMSPRNGVSPTNSPLDDSDSANLESQNGIDQINAQNRLKQINLPLTLRILWFGAYTVLLAAVSIYIVVDKSAANSSLPDLVNATLAPAVVICFGSQRDVLLACKSGITWPVRKYKSMQKSKQRKESMQRQQTIDARNPVDAKELVESPGILSPKPELEAMDMFEALAWLDSDGRSNHSR